MVPKETILSCYLLNFLPLYQIGCSLECSFHCPLAGCHSVGSGSTCRHSFTLTVTVNSISRVQLHIGHVVNVLNTLWRGLFYIILLLDEAICKGEFPFFRASAVSYLGGRSINARELRLLPFRVPSVVEEVNP